MHPSSQHSVASSGAAVGDDPRTKKPILAQRFRTKLCNKFATTGSCPYVHRCMFAHGKDELRTAGQNVAAGLVSEEAIRAFKREQYEARAAGSSSNNHGNAPAAGGATRGGGTAMPAAVSSSGFNASAAPFGPLPSAAAELAAGTCGPPGHPTPQFVVQGGGAPQPPATAAFAAAAGIDPYFALFPGVLSPFAAPPATTMHHAPPPMSWLPPHAPEATIESGGDQPFSRRESSGDAIHSRAASEPSSPTTTTSAR